MINQSKLNLSEKDIENWLWDNPNELTIGTFHNVTGWIGRQIKVPSGIIDLLGYYINDEIAWPVVVEIKNTQFTQSSILQVCRYAYDIENVIDYSKNFENKMNWSHVSKIVVALGNPGRQLLYEAESVQVVLHSFNIDCTFSISGA